MRLRPVLALGDNDAFDAVHRNEVEAHSEENPFRVNHFDLLTFTRPQRASQVAGVTADNDCAPAFAFRKKRRQCFRAAEAATSS
jgi:hypothetical protein